MSSRRAARSVLVIHGGAGGTGAAPSDERRAACEAGLLAALRAGDAVLADGGPALDAVVAAVRVLEDAPEFNAGRGAVLSSDGRVELSAAVMRGSDRAAGAIAGARVVRYPVEGARALLEHEHVFVIGPEADRFALAAGCERADESFFVTAERREQWERRRREGGVELDHDQGHPQARDAEGHEAEGTVGAVACDARGELAAATSTGGVANQLAGRVGDTPLIGAGTWADSAVCAVSATGRGEAFLRAAFAHRVADRIELAGESLEDACAHALAEVARFGGRGGCIAVDASGAIALPYDTPQMLRGWVRTGQEPHVAI